MAMGALLPLVACNSCSAALLFAPEVALQRLLAALYLASGQLASIFAWHLDQIGDCSQNQLLV